MSQSYAASKKLTLLVGIDTDQKCVRAELEVVVYTCNPSIQRLKQRIVSLISAWATE
jgi:hypothetical protein